MCVASAGQKAATSPSPTRTPSGVEHAPHYTTSYLERQVAQNNRPLYPKIAHKGAKVAHNYRLLAFQVLPKQHFGSRFCATRIESPWTWIKTLKPFSGGDQRHGAACATAAGMLYCVGGQGLSSKKKLEGTGSGFNWFWGSKDQGQTTRLL